MRFLTALLLAGLIVAAPYSVHAILPETIKCYKIDAPSTPVIDGDVSEWPAAFLADSFRNDLNIYCIHPQGRWYGFKTDFQAYLYLCHDDSFLYMGWKTTIDNYDAPNENIMLCFGGSRLVTLSANLKTPVAGASFNDAWLPNMKFGWGRDVYPTYEISMKLSDLGTSPYTIGYNCEDIDADCQHWLGMSSHFMNSEKGDPALSAQVWLDLSTYPYTRIIDSLPPKYVAVEKTPVRQTLEPMTIAPNPCTPSTEIRVHVSGAYALKIFDASGALVRVLARGNAEQTPTRRIAWDGKDRAGATLRNGIYFCRLETGGQAFTQKIVLAR
jgi:hypothetical protein